MGKRHPNPGLVKIHRSYTVEEIASLFDLHKNTVRSWVNKDGLSVVDDKRPMLIHGKDLAAFLQAKRTKNKRTCRPGEMYCFRCRAPKIPAGGMADCLPVTEKIGHLTAICPDCECMMHQRVSMAKLEQVRAKLAITFPQALRRVSESSQPNVNSDFR